MYGIINLFKEKGITSFKQINMLKKIFPDVKIGHTGTLDPIADGVLIVCIGKATRLVTIFRLKKRYISRDDFRLIYRFI
jgi:tRNA pseudouridine55 synthase